MNHKNGVWFAEVNLNERKHKMSLIGFDIFYHRLNKEMTLDVTCGQKFESFNLIEVLELSSHNKDKAQLLNALEDYCKQLKDELLEEAYQEAL